MSARSLFPGLGLEAEGIEPALVAREWSVDDPATTQLVLLVSRHGALIEPTGRTGLVAPALAMLPGAPGRSLRFEAGARGIRIAVANDVLAAAISGVPGGGRVRRLLGRPAIVPGARLDGAVGDVAASFAALAREARSRDDAAPAFAAAHLALVCLHVWRLSGRAGEAAGAPTERAASVAQRFLNLVELHWRDGWSVKRYADVLGVTEDRLNAACVRKAGKPPGRVIRDRLAVEAAVALGSSDLPVEQIAFALGFRDPGYFSRFCRRHLGAPPGRYRRDQRAARPALTHSYAAWP